MQAHGDKIVMSPEEELRAEEIVGGLRGSFSARTKQTTRKYTGGKVQPLAAALNS